MCIRDRQKSVLAYPEFEHIGSVFVGVGGEIIGETTSSVVLPLPPQLVKRNMMKSRLRRKVLFRNSSIQIKFLHKTPNS